MHPYVHSSAICNSKDIVDEWIQKIVGGVTVCVCVTVCVYAHKNILLSHKI